VADVDITVSFTSGEACAEVCVEGVEHDSPEFIRDLIVRCRDEMFAWDVQQRVLDGTLTRDG
jgi:hypothetical protein